MNKNSKNEKKYRLQYTPDKGNGLRLIQASASEKNVLEIVKKGNKPKGCPICSSPSCLSMRKILALNFVEALHRDLPEGCYRELRLCREAGFGVRRLNEALLGARSVSDLDFMLKNQRDKFYLVEKTEEIHVLHKGKDKKTKEDKAFHCPACSHYEFGLSDTQLKKVMKSSVSLIECQNCKTTFVVRADEFPSIWEIVRNSLNRNHQGISGLWHTNDMIRHLFIQYPVSVHQKILHKNPTFILKNPIEHIKLKEPFPAKEILSIIKKLAGGMKESCADTKKPMPNLVDIYFRDEVKELFYSQFDNACLAEMAYFVFPSKMIKAIVVSTTLTEKPNAVMLNNLVSCDSILGAMLKRFDEKEMVEGYADFVYMLKKGIKGKENKRLGWKTYNSMRKLWNGLIVLPYDP